MDREAGGEDRGGSKTKSMGREGSQNVSVISRKTPGIIPSQFQEQITKPSASVSFMVLDLPK